MMSAGLESDEESGPSRPTAGLSERHRLGVRLPPPTMIPLADDPPPSNHDRTDVRIRMRTPAAGKCDRPPHPALIV
jgi:hypothetical protein